MKALLLLASAATLGLFAFSLKSSSPAKDSLIEDPPLKVVLAFTEKVRADSSAITILHRDTTDFFSIDVKATEDPTVVEAVVPRKLLGGHYLIRWKTMSIDGVKLSGLYSFAVDVPE